MTAKEYFGDWCKVVDVNEAERVVEILKKQPICPRLKDLFKAFKLCPFKSLRVVIIGKDPYPNNRATGIAFANEKNIPEDSYSPSLEVLRESVIDFTVPHQHINFDPSLEKWEEQGVLMLNSALSCLPGKSGSHALMWRPFIKTLLTNLSIHTTGIVYVLMGNSAKSYESYINEQFNFIIKLQHPSYYARTRTQMPDIWKKINKILIGQNGHGIEWY